MVRRVGPAIVAESLLALSIMLACASGSARHDSTMPPLATGCDSVVDSTAVASSAARITEGSYRLTLVGTSGMDSGTMQVYRMRLWRASARDRSPQWPDERPPAGDTATTPLYGALTLPKDYTYAGRPASPSEVESPLNAPYPDSRDPLHPGVLVELAVDASGRATWVLLIGSVINRRVVARPRPDHMMYAPNDGGGDILHVRRTGSLGFQGHWGPMGSASRGEGYFCAERLPLQNAPESDGASVH